jgi:hypothetical protein
VRNWFQSLLFQNATCVPLRLGLHTSKQKLIAKTEKLLNQYDTDGGVGTALPGGCQIAHMDHTGCQPCFGCKGCHSRSRGVSDWLHGTYWLSSTEPCFDCKNNVT